MRFRATAVVLALLPLFHSVAETIAFQNCLAPTRTTFAVRPWAQTARSCRQEFSLFGSRSLLPPSVENKDEDPPRKRDIARALWRTAVKRVQWLQALASTAVKNLSTAVKNLVGHANFKKSIICLVWFLLLGTVVQDSFPSFQHKPLPPTRAPIEVPYSKFMDYCEGTDAWVHIDNVKVDRRKLGYRVFRAETRSQRAVLKRMKQQHGAGHQYDNTITPEDMARLPQTHAYTHTVDVNNEVVQFMRKNKVTFQANSANLDQKALGLGLVVPAAILLVWSQSDRSSSSSRSPGKMAKKNKGNVKMPSFDDIQGIDDAKRDVMELVDTLRNPEKYSLVGARAPTGLLLEGPSGTGKTTLARATAAMADVPLLYCSGSEFVEMYVGNGAARVRKLFAQAEKIKGPCLIFIDEIDALGKARGDAGGYENRDEAEQTLNQLLACMDGLGSSSGICVMGATNRKDVLDPALIRPGRFDRIVKVDLPSKEGRESILRTHAKKLVGFTEGSGADPSRENSLGRGKAVDLSAVAAVTEGLSGAELEYIVNEAAIRAVRRVSVELNQGVDKTKVDTTVYTKDFEASVKSFFESRNAKKKSKAFGIMVPSGAERWKTNNARPPNQIFIT